MEALFVRILNVSLVVVGFLTLAGAIIAVGFLALAAAPILFADTSTRELRVAYVPISQVSGSITSENKVSQEAPPPAAVDPIQRVCAARQAIVKTLSRGQLDLDANKCKSDMSGAYTGERQINFLSEDAAYLQAAANDPQLSSKFPATSDSNAVESELDQIDADFDKKFDEKAQSDNSRIQREQERIALAKVYSVTLLTSALSAFLAFLIVAFLIVAIRIEKHIATISGKTPSA